METRCWWEAAFDTPEAQAAGAQARALGNFDAVLPTDISSSFESWHRARWYPGRHGVGFTPQACVSFVSAQVSNPHSCERVVLLQDARHIRSPKFRFSCMVVLPEVLELNLDGITFDGSDGLWWAARSSSKPGLQTNASGPSGGAFGGECWTLISTPAFAVAEITRVTMQDPQTGAFRPQADDYLNSEPGPHLYRAFVKSVTPLLRPGTSPPPTEPLYLQAQRWGSAFPSPAAVGGRNLDGYHHETAHQVLGALRERDTSGQSPLSNDSDDSGRGRDRDLNDKLHLLRRDYCSRRPPGFEAACLSGLDAASALHLSWVFRTRKHSSTAALNICL